MPQLNVLDRLQEQSLGYRRMDDFNAPDFFKVDCGGTGRLRPGLDANEEWCLTATLAVTFWANGAQYSRAKEIAEHALVHRLYADILGDLAELQLQISSGGRDECHRIVNRIKSKLTY